MKKIATFMALFLLAHIPLFSGESNFRDGEHQKWDPSVEAKKYRDQASEIRAKILNLPPELKEKTPQLTQLAEVYERMAGLQEKKIEAMKRKDRLLADRMMKDCQKLQSEAMELRQELRSSFERVAQKNFNQNDPKKMRENFENKKEFSKREFRNSEVNPEKAKEPEKKESKEWHSYE